MSLNCSPFCFMYRRFGICLTTNERENKMTMVTYVDPEGKHHRLPFNEAGPLHARNGGSILSEPTTEPVAETATPPINVIDIAAARQEARAQEAKETFLTELGYVPVPGRKFYGSHGDKASASQYRPQHRAFEAMPDSVDSLVEVIDQIKAEERRDLRVGTGDIKLTDRRTLIVGDEEYSFEEGGFKALVQVFGSVVDNPTKDMAAALERPKLGLPYGARLLAMLPPGEAADIFAKQSYSRGLLIRTRKLPGMKRTIWHVASDTYGIYDVDSVALATAQAFIDYGPKGTVTYNAETSSLNAQMLWHDSEIVLGRPHKFGVFVKTNDTSKGSVQGGGILFDHVCLNMSMLRKKQNALFSRAHRGSTLVLRTFVEENLEKVADSCRRYLVGVNKLTQVSIDDLFPTEEGTETRVRDIFEEILELPEMKQVKMKNAVLLEGLLNNWQLEPGDDVVSFVRTMSRCHEKELAHVNVQQLEAAEADVMSYCLRQANRRDLIN